ncbi:uncharacterized protein LOC143195827 [Rhynchophorus ferrugineus]|uniref:Uncharacterized protein n=1 Tax=Rhynchophorus ferrugineus TaxID=354439 RepID=A0A834MEE7_RHYFE|nr:hypothetical protein GWI33_008120 [Rhynchophorus ferrugineus]
MSLSTLTLRAKHANFDEINMKLPKFQEPKSSTLLLLSLWIFQSIFSACKMEFYANMQGISISFNIQDVILISFAAWMLHKGLSSRNIALIFPWVIVTLYGLYYNHYRSLRRMTALLKSVRLSSALPWIALFLTAVGLVLRMILTIRTLQLSANLWYRKKLEKELYQTLN